MPFPASEYAYALGSEASAMGVSCPQFSSCSAARPSTERAIGALSPGRAVLTTTSGSRTMRGSVSGAAPEDSAAGPEAARACGANPRTAAVTMANGTEMPFMARAPVLLNDHPAANTSSDAARPGEIGSMDQGQ